MQDDLVKVTRKELRLAEEVGMIWQTHHFETAAVQAAAVFARHRAAVEAAQADRITALEAALSKLLAAISWIEPPFVDDNTSEDELRQRIGFVIADTKRSQAIRALMENSNAKPK